MSTTSAASQCQRSVGTGTGHSHRSLVNSIWGISIYVALVALAFTVNYPGRLNPDSADQLTQAVHPQLLNDWHEPWIIGFWRLFWYPLGEPAGALLIQSLILFVYPSMLITRARAAGSRSAWTWFPLIIFTGSLVEISGQIVKDALLLGFILCLLAVVDSGEFLSRQRWKILLALVPIIAAPLIRPVNAFIFGIAAVLGLLAYRVRWRSAMPAIIIILIVSALQIPLIKIIDGSVLGATRSKAESSVMIFDIAGISTTSHSDLFAAIPAWPMRVLPRPWDCYTPYYWDQFMWGKCRRYFDLFNAHVLDRFAFWTNAILSHPLAYALHRTRYLFQCIGSAAPIATFTAPYALNSAETRAQLFGSFTHGIDMRGQFQLWHPTIASQIVEWIAAAVFSRLAGLVEMAACLTAVGLGIRRGHATIDRITFVAAGIGIANLFVMAIFGVAAEDRYLLPTYVCGLLVLMRTDISRVLLPIRG